MGEKGDTQRSDWVENWRTVEVWMEDGVKSVLNDGVNSIKKVRRALISVE